jgi:hypothetical protein
MRLIPVVLVRFRLAGQQCRATPNNGDLGVAGAAIITPKDPSRSILSLRMHAVDAQRMPSVATRVVDTTALGVIDAWISSMDRCPDEVIGPR